MASHPERDGGPSGARQSPIRVQYDALKRAHPGCILLFQCGDFYETFEGDARVVAQACGITLTSKELARGDRVPLAGFPLVRAERHIGRLVAAGHHVAICDQVSEPGHGLVERRVTRVVTAGTVAEPGLIAPTENNLLASLRRGRSGIALAHVDVMTGELLATTIEGPDADEALEAELQRLQPAECLVGPDETVPDGLGGHLTRLDRARFDERVAEEGLRERYGVGSLEGFGLTAARGNGELGAPMLGAIGAIVAYLDEKNRPLLQSLREPRTYSVGAYMTLDPSTRRNLELTRTAWGNRQRGSLIGAIDRTRTAMGARRLRRALGQPLLDRVVLERRLDAVESLLADPERRAQLRQGLGRLGDLERLLGRIRQGSATPREALGLARALRVIPELVDPLDEAGFAPRLPDLWPPVGAGLAPPIPRPASRPAAHPSPLQELSANAAECVAVADLIDGALAEVGGSRTIRPGHSQELDALVDGIAGSRRWLAELERRERERTTIRSLKVGYNKIFGYFIEITKPNLAQVPPDYTRRQTLVNAERFVTPELKEHEARILTAEARIDDLERELFLALLRRVGEHARALVATVVAVAELDFHQSLAECAAERGWTRPTFANGVELVVDGGRHPVLEDGLAGAAPAGPSAGEFVPNDCRLGAEDGEILLVTGPNMAGKSTYLRQVALIVLLAQIGSFVPARATHLGLVDRIFTRVGSHDDLAAGTSTFLVEMAETANILRHASERSLIVLDEVGRGTSTHDGLCIARAVLEHLHDAIGARTLFATHYHELTALTDALPGLRNVTVAVDDEDDRLAFLYRVVPGAANRSYGVQVARLAGLPHSVTDRAATLLEQFEGETPSGASRELSRPEVAQGNLPDPTDDLALPPMLDLEQDGVPNGSASLKADDMLGPLQLREWAIPYDAPPSLADGAAVRLLGELLGLDLSGLTPLRALNLLHEMQATARAAVPWQEWLSRGLRTED